MTGVQTCALPICETYLTNTTESSRVIQNIDRQMAAQKHTIKNSLDNQITQLLKRIDSFEESEKDINKNIATAPRQVEELQSVYRQQKVKEALFIFLLQKREENELSITNTAWNSNIIQPPTGSPRPTSPKTILIGLFALIIGTIIPGGILFVQDYMNTKVRGRKDLENTSLQIGRAHV